MFIGVLCEQCSSGAKFTKHFGTILEQFYDILCTFTVLQQCANSRNILGQFCDKNLTTTFLDVL